MHGLLAMLLLAAPQAKVIRAEAFVATSRTTDKEAAEATRAVKDELAKQGYRLADKDADFVLSGLISRSPDRLIIDAQLSTATERTLVASAHSASDQGLTWCAHEVAQQLGSKLREATGVRVKLKAK